jgi:hypothetical protein
MRMESNDTESRCFSNNVYTPSKVMTSSDAGLPPAHKQLVLRLDQLYVETQALQFLD